MLKKLLHNQPIARKLHHFLHSSWSAIYTRFVMLDYRQKRNLILSYAKTHNNETLIETGTFLGDTVEALKGDFKRLISIELSEELAQKATLRFRNDTNIKIHNGDSGKILPSLLKNISEPCLFWLGRALFF